MGPIDIPDLAVDPGPKAEHAILRSPKTVTEAKQVGIGQAGEALRRHFDAIPPGQREGCPAKVQSLAQIQPLGMRGRLALQRIQGPALVGQFRPKPVGGIDRLPPGATHPVVNACQGAGHPLFGAKFFQGSAEAEVAVSHEKLASPGFHLGLLKTQVLHDPFPVFGHVADSPLLEGRRARRARNRKARPSGACRLSWNPPSSAASSKRTTTRFAPCFSSA